MINHKNYPPVFDGHNDFLHTQYIPGLNRRSFFQKSNSGHLDLPRAREGGFCGGFFAIFIPHPAEVAFFIKQDEGNEDQVPYDLFENLKPVEHSYALDMARKGIQIMYQLEDESNGGLRVVRHFDDIQMSLNQGTISAIIHFEGAEPIDKHLHNLDYFYEQGLRSIGLVWSRANAFGHGVNFKFPGSPDQGPGLSAAGKELAAACNRLGIMIDLSHLNEKGFWDIEKISSAPLIATHSCVHSLCPQPRNLTDNQIDAIAGSGGLIGINFGTRFIRHDGRSVTDTPIEELVSHFQFIADRVGVEHAAIGSDFDGAEIIDKINDASKLPELLHALKLSGFTDSDIEKISYKNWMRVLADTWSSN